MREKHQEELTELKGYAGSTTEGLFKLYTDLSATTYWEIPEKSILHTQTGCEDCGDANMLSIFVLSTLEIKQVKMMKAANSHTPFPPSPFEPLPPVKQIGLHDIFNQNGLFPSPNCIQKCIESIRSNGAYFSLTSGSSPQTIQYCINTAGKNALYNCLYRCGYRGSLLRHVWLQAIDKLCGEATYTEDPSMPEIPPFP